MAVRNLYSTSALDELMPPAETFYRGGAAAANDPAAVQFGQHSVAAPLPGESTPMHTYDPMNPAGANAGYVMNAVQPGSGRITPGGGGWKGINLNSSFDPKQALNDAGIIGLEVGRTLTNPTRVLNPYLPDELAVALNPVGALTEQGIATVQNQIPGAPSNTTQTPLSNVYDQYIGGGNTPSYVPRTGTGGGAGGGGSPALDNALSRLDAVAGGGVANAGTAYGYQAPQMVNSGAGYVPYSDPGGGVGYVPYSEAGVPGGGGAGYVPYQDAAGTNGYIPYQDQGQFRMLGYTGDSFIEAPLADYRSTDIGYTGGRQEDPLLGYIPYTEEVGPSAAEALLTTYLERAQAGALGQAAMARGGPGAVARAQREARGANMAMQSRGAAELAALRAEEAERRQNRLFQGEMSAREREVGELTAQRGRQSQEEIAARGRELDEVMAGRSRELAADTALRERQSTERVAGRERELQELLALAERQMTGELAARARESDELIAYGNRMMTGEISARDRASAEDIARASRYMTGEVSALDRASTEGIASANRTLQGEVAARDRASAEAIAADNRASMAEVAARDREAQSFNMQQQRQLDAENASLDRALKAAVAQGDIASQQLIQDKINQNAIDRLYLQDELGTPTMEERLMDGAASILPIASRKILGI